MTEFFLIFGSVFILLASLGMLRFPDFYTRLHASTKLVTLGGLGILLGAGFHFGVEGAFDRVVIIAALFLLTAPLSGYMVSRAGYLSGMQPESESGSVDEWDACGAVEGPEDVERSGQVHGLGGMNSDI